MSYLPSMIPIAKSVLTGTAASITFSSIPGNYSNLQVLWEARGDAAGTAVTLNLQLNADTGSSYDYAYLQESSSSALGSQSSAQTSGYLAHIAAVSSTANYAAGGDLILCNYAGTTFYKHWIARTQRADANNIYVLGGTWKSTAAITSVKLFPGSGNFISGSVFTLYGIS